MIDFGIWTHNRIPKFVDPNTNSLFKNEHFFIGGGARSVQKIHRSPRFFVPLFRLLELLKILPIETNPSCSMSIAAAFPHP